MAADELSYSESLKCKNASVKVTINRCRERYDDILEDPYYRWFHRPFPLIEQDFEQKTGSCSFLIGDSEEGWPLLGQYCRRLQRLFQQDLEPETIDHGSGFVIADNLVITNWHVIEEAMRNETLVIRILNETIGEMPCVVLHCDPSNDLALLYCRDLNLKRHGICPFTLSEEALWPSVSVCSFGYPLTHTGRSALFVKGYVAGLKNRYGDNRKPFWVLNCDLNHGNSGGPVLRRIGDDIKVVGVVAQKHKKEILTLEELNILEAERSTLQTNFVSDSRDQFWKSVSLKMYDALNETHCQFGYGNVVPGHLVVEFLSASLTSMVDRILNRPVQ